MIGYATWHSPIGERPFHYFEMFGETSPLITPGYTKLLLPEENEGPKHSTNLAPLYEYYWSLGYLEPDGPEKKWGQDLWRRMHRETAAEVYLYFPTTGGWWIQELLATVKYLVPGREHAAVLQNASHLFATAQPIVEDVSKLARVGSGLPGVGPIAASSAVLLDVIAKLKITSVPPVKQYRWSVQKVADYIPGEGVVHGVRWTIPTRLFQEFGSRLTGSIAVSIIPATPGPSASEFDHIQLTSKPIRAKALIRRYPGPQKGDLHLPNEGSDKYLELGIEPSGSEEKRMRLPHL